MFNIQRCVRTDSLSLCFLGIMGMVSLVWPVQVRGFDQTAMTFVDAEVPSGILDGINRSFVLSRAPSPADSLALYRNGMYLRRNVDYTLTDKQLLFLLGAVPSAGDVLVCSYRATTASPAAFFINLDTTTQGNWSSVYGSDGYTVVGDQTINPSYVTPVPTGQSVSVWAGSTTDVRGLTKPSNFSDRIAATWYSATTRTFSVDLDFKDANTHQMAIYCVDWNSAGRRQTVDILDPSGNVLNTQSLSPSFTSGAYLVWNVSGHINVRVTATAASNPVAGAFFFDPAGSPPSMVASAGDGQTALIGQPFASTLQVSIKDRTQKPVQSATVTFTAPSVGAGATFVGGNITATSSTDATGVAVSPTFAANALQGKYTISAAAGSLPPVSFSLANFQPPTNLALGKAADQSSTYVFQWVAAAAAVDGNTDGSFFDKSLTHTNLDVNAWWQVDLGNSATVSFIVIWNRTDCCASRLSDYWVFVSNTPFAASDTPSTLQNRPGTWSNHQTSAPNPYTVIPVGGTQGRYVRVQLTGSDYLSLAEVQVMGTSP